MSSLRLDRRTVLRGAFGTAVALPTLECMLTSTGLVRGAAQAAPAKAPRRFLAIAQANGAPMDEWWPAAGAGTTSYPLSPLLEPLGAQLAPGVLARDYVSVLGGLDHVGGGGHSACRLLTGESYAPSCGISADQVLAKLLPIGTTRLQSLCIAAVQEATSAAVQPFRLFNSWLGNNMPVATMSYDAKTGAATDPKELFGKLFPSAAPRPSGGPDYRQRIVDAVKEDGNRLLARLGGEDRKRVQEHMNVIHEMEVGLFRASPVSADCKAPIEPAVSDGGRVRAEQLLALTVLALKCDITRYATFTFGPGMCGYKLPWITNGSLHGDHVYAHNQTDIGSTPYPVTADYRRALGRARVEMIVNVMRQMWNIQEGDGRLLDNTIILYGNEASRGHSERDIPILLAGRGGGTHKPGKYVRYPQGTLHANLLLSIMNMVGVETKTFGRSGTKVLSEIMA